MGYYTGKLMGVNTMGVNPIPIDYILAYDFNNSLIDKSNNGNNGIGSGSYTFSAVTDGVGKTKNCITFPNTGTNRITTTNTVFLSDTDKVSFSVWFKVNNTALAILFDALYTTQNHIEAMHGINAGVAYYYVSDRQGSNSNQRRYAVLTGYDMNWHHLVGTFNRSLVAGSESILYFDGIAVNTILNSVSDLSGLFSDFKYCFGGGKSGYNFIGSLANFRMYKKVLTQDEITQLYNE